MTTFSFEIEKSEVAKLKAVLKAFGAKKLKIEEEKTEMSKEEFEGKINKSLAQVAEGKVQKLTPTLKKELFKSIL